MSWLACCLWSRHSRTSLTQGLQLHLFPCNRPATPLTPSHPLPLTWLPTKPPDCAFPAPHLNPHLLLPSPTHPPNPPPLPLCPRPQALSEGELSQVLTEPKNALTKQYAGIFSKNDCKFHITVVRGHLCVYRYVGGRAGGYVGGYVYSCSEWWVPATSPGYTAADLRVRGL